MPAVRNASSDALHVDLYDMTFAAGETRDVSDEQAVELVRNPNFTLTEALAVAMVPAADPTPEPAPAEES